MRLQNRHMLQDNSKQSRRTGLWGGGTEVVKAEGAWKGARGRGLVKAEQGRKGAGQYKHIK